MKQFIIKFILLITMFINHLLCNAQEVKVTGIFELTTDITARTESRQDNNGKDCALLRINIPSIKNMTFSQNVVGDILYTPGEYLVYVPEGTKQLSYSFNGKKGEDVNFEEYGIDIKGKMTYKITMNVEKHKNNVNGGSLSISANIDGVLMLLDGAPIGFTPLSIDDVSTGKHLLSVINTIGYTMNDTTIVIDDNNCDIRLTFKEKEPDSVNFDVEYAAGMDGSTGGWERYKISRKNGKYGLTDLADYIFIPCEYDSIFPIPIDQEYYAVMKNGGWGFYKLGEGLVIPCEYDKYCNWWEFLEFPNTPAIIYVTKGEGRNNRGVIDCKGNVIVPCEYESITSRPSGGIIKADKIIYNSTRTSYRHFSDFYNLKGEAIVKNLDTQNIRYIIFDRQGNAIIEYNDKTLACIDSQGNYYKWSEDLRMVSTTYDHLWYSTDLYPVKKGDKCGFVDKSGNERIPFIYDHALPFYKDWACVIAQTNSPIKAGWWDISFEHEVCGENEYVYINKNGNIQFQCDDRHKYVREILSNGDEYMRETIYKSNRHLEDPHPDVIEKKVYDCNSHVILASSKLKSLEYINIPGYFWGCDDNKEYIYDEKMNLKIEYPGVSDEGYIVHEYKDGFAVIVNEEKGTYGYLNEKGDFIANCIYDFNPDYAFQLLCGEGENGNGDGRGVRISEGLAILMIGGRFGFIDNTGKVVIPLNYTGAVPFKNNISYLRRQDGTWIRVVKDNNNNIIEGL